MKEKSLFTDFNWVFNSIVEKRRHICILGAYLWVMKSIMDFKRKIPSLESLIASIVFNDSLEVKICVYWTFNEIWEVGEYWLKNSENWATQMQVIPFWNNMHLSQPYTLSTHFKVCRTQCHLELNCSSMGLKLYCYSISKRTKDLFSTCDHQSLFYFIFNYLIVIYFIFISLTTYPIYLIDTILKLYWITQVIYNV